MSDESRTAAQRQSRWDNACQAAGLASLILLAGSVVVFVVGLYAASEAGYRWEPVVWDMAMLALWTAAAAPLFAAAMLCCVTWWTMRAVRTG